MSFSGVAVSISFVETDKHIIIMDWSKFENLWARNFMPKRIASTAFSHNALPNCVAPPDQWFFATISVSNSLDL